MAGHPVVGSTFALARDGAIADGRTDWVFGLNIGPTPVSLEWNDSRLDFAWMTQRNPEFGPTSMMWPRSRQRWGCRSTTSARPIFPSSMYRAACRSSSSRSQRDRPSIAPCRTCGCSTSRPTSLQPIGSARPIRLPHIPGCSLRCSGSVKIPRQAAQAGRWVRISSLCLVTTQQGRSILNLQGVKLGRPSWIHVSIESSDAGITRVRVGGNSVFVAEGTMEIDQNSMPSSRGLRGTGRGGGAPRQIE